MRAPRGPPSRATTRARSPDAAARACAPSSRRRLAEADSELDRAKHATRKLATRLQEETSGGHETGFELSIELTKLEVQNQKLQAELDELRGGKRKK